jgi:uroporphyrinogen decarboxylase
VTDPADLTRFDFPTADWIDYSTVRKECERARGYPVFTGAPGILDFINGIAHGRGVEQVLVDIALEDPVYIALLDKKFAFHYETMERTLQAADGLIDVVHTGEDLGIQRGLLINPQKFDRLFGAKYRAFFAMVHRYGAMTMMHCCGSVYGLLPRLIDVGLDILDVVQTSAAKMDLRGLREEFGRELSFCGTMCVQTTLPHSTADQVVCEVALRQEMFADGGLILGPTHAIQPDTPFENILALYRAAGSLAG